MQPGDIAANYFNRKQRAEMLIEVDRFSEALDELQADLAEHPDDYYSLCQSSYCHLNLGEYQTAYDLSKKAVEASPDGEWAHRLQSSIYAATGDNIRAYEAAVRSVNASPWSLPCLETLMFAQIGLWRLDEADETLSKMFEAAPNEEISQNAAGYLFLKKEDLAKAEEHYLAALKLNPESLSALNNLGVIYLEYAETGKGKAYRKKSEEMFERAVRAQPTFKDGQENLALARKSIAKAGIPIASILILCWAVNFLGNMGRQAGTLLPEVMNGLTILNPYSVNKSIFGLNLLFIAYAVLVTIFAVRYFFSSDRAAMIEPFTKLWTWAALAIGTVIPSIFYLIFFFLIETEANSFAVIALIVLFAASLYASLKSLLYCQLRNTD